VRRVRVRIEGRVQGVGFRWSLRRRADSLRVSGWAANLDDGAVEALLEGEDERVESLLAWCRRGPSGADVKAVDATPEEPRGERGFVVR
jgi:acylphosphatase